jgi:hypothetical protein
VRSYEPPLGEVRRYEFGPMTLYVARNATDWDVGARLGDDPHAAVVDLDGPGTREDLSACTWRVRYPAPSHVHQLALAAASADRPVIARPESTLLVPARASTVVYLGSPVWVRILLGDEQIAELPAWRPSDTWFGPSTTEGELCYASRTMARTVLEELPFSPIRAITETTIANATDAAVRVDRIGLPLPAMSVFRSAGGRMWTEAVRVSLEESGASATRVGKGPPAIAGECTRLASPRRPPDSGGLVRAFSALMDMSRGHPWSG